MCYTHYSLISDLGPDKKKDLSEQTRSPPEAESSNKEEDSLVEVYADRLCAVTHAFALCCRVLQKSNARYEAE